MFSEELLRNILYAVLFFVALGACSGILLAVADRLFAVKQDPRIPQIQQCLPGANCGGCGYTGCAACAEAIATGQAKLSACPVGGQEVASAIASVMGVEAEKTVRMRAQVMCSGTAGVAKLKYLYQGAADCAAASRIGGGNKLCPNGCIGLGSCASICPFGAIRIQNGVAFVDYRTCRGCGLCADACPKHIIRLVPFEASEWVGCSCQEKGALTRNYCDAGCIGCRLCEKKCPADAIHVTGALAAIDYEKCIGCGACATSCPRGIIHTANMRSCSSNKVQTNPQTERINP